MHVYSVHLVAADCVTLVDDPFHKDNPEPMNFDAEGSPTHKKAVIENGVLNTLLYNLKTAAVAGKTTTGMVKFLLKVAQSKQKLHIISGQDLGVVEKNIIMY